VEWVVTGARMYGLVPAHVNMWEKIPPEIAFELHTIFTTLRDEKNSFHVGSLFSGSAIHHILMKHGVEEQSRKRLGVIFKMVHQYCSEIGEVQCEFIKKAHPDLQYLFGRAIEVANEMAYDKKSGSMVIVPFVHMLIWGFACQTGSKANNKRTTNNVQRSAGKTGSTFDEGFEVMKFHRPPYAVLENTKDLASTGGSSDICDMDYIIAKLEGIGYWCKGFEIEAYDYSSKTWRCRLYLGAVLEERRSLTREAHMKNTLRCLRLTPHPMEVFLITDIELKRRMKKKRFILETTYQEVHALLYEARGLQWPPSRAALATLKGLVDQPNATQRMTEAVYYIGKVFAYTLDKSDVDGFQYVDVNRSLEWLTGCEGKKDPWMKKLGTFTTKTCWIIRRATHDIDIKNVNGPLTPLG
jgi:site-specific DNA-cytosine methylase